MANPTEQMPSESLLTALAETTDAETGFTYLEIGQAPCYTTELGEQWKLNRMVGLANSLRVVKDGALTYGVFSGAFAHQGAAVSYAGSTGNALTDDQTNYLYLDTTGTLQINTTGFPTAAHVPLATIVAASGTYDHSDITDCRDRAIFRTVGQVQLAADPVRFDTLRNADGKSLLDGAASNFDITDGGWSAGTRTIDGNPASGAAVTDTLVFEWIVPRDYVAAADVKMVVHARESVGAATVSTTLSAEVYEDDSEGGVSADLAASWDDDDVTAAWADHTLTITDADLVCGDRLRIYLRTVTDDSGGAVGTVAQIGRIEMQYDRAIGY